MADKPILFSAPMVRALLAGTKTQTRRGISLSRYRGFTEFGKSDTKGYDWHLGDSGMRWQADALAEGMTQATAEAIMGPEELATYAATHIACPEARGRILYETLWNHINGPGSWKDNPWIAAYTFTVHHGNIDQMGAE